VPEESKEMITNYDGICIAHHIWLYGLFNQ
jgi:hypothetical protein